METALLLAAVVIAGGACPAVMWWNQRRGRDAACGPPAKQSAPERAGRPAGD